MSYLEITVMVLGLLFSHVFAAYVGMALYSYKRNPGIKLKYHFTGALTNRPAYDPFNDDEKIMRGEVESYFD